MTDFQQANRCMVAKEYQRAIELFLRHAEVCPAEAAQAFAGVAECFLQTNTIQKPVQTVPGISLVFQGDRQGAEKYFRLALQADPNNPRALWGLARLLSEKSVERRELLERSVTVLPGTLNLLALGDTYRSQFGDFQRAYDVYKRAQEHAPRDKSAYMRLNDICRRMGRHEEAAEWSRRWQEAKQQTRRRDGKG
jgi:tetratricopeptide (TPR) repeat protein